MPMPLIAEIYLMSAILGALVLVVSAAMGFGGHAHVGHAHGGIGHGGAHGGVGGGAHGGAHGMAHTGGHGAAHTTGGHGAAHATGGHGAAHAGSGHVAAGHGGSAQSSSAHAGTAHGTGRAGGQTTGQSAAAASNAAESNPSAALSASVKLPAVMQQRSDRLAVFLTLINPTTLSAFCVWFGVFGLFAWRLLPFLPVTFTLPIAIAAGLLGTKLTLYLMGAVVNRMFSSASFQQDTLIGAEAEVTVSIDAIRTGEITCLARGPRYSLSARSLRPEDTFKRGARVIISDIRSDIAYVERWPEDDFGMDGTPEGQATLDTTAVEKLPNSQN